MEPEIGKRSTGKIITWRLWPAWNLFFFFFSAWKEESRRYEWILSFFFFFWFLKIDTIDDKNLWKWFHCSFVNGIVTLISLKIISNFFFRLKWSPRVSFYGGEELNIYDEIVKRKEWLVTLHWIIIKKSIELNFCN